MLKVPQHFLADFDFCFTSNAKEIRRHFGFFLVGMDSHRWSVQLTSILMDSVK